MLITLKKWKQGFISNAEFRKYSLYALGEMALVVIGILIALQIDNWNTEKLEQRTLNNYLQTIARNISSDLDSIVQLRSERIDTYESSLRWLTFETRNRSYTVPEIAFAGQLFTKASTLRYFNASGSGYEALKASGAFDQMQGTDIEVLLYDYYDTVARIARMEQSHNELCRLLSLQVLANWPDSILRWELEVPDALTVDRFAALQPDYRMVLGDVEMRELQSAATLIGPLLNEYNKLDHLGRTFKYLVGIGSTDLDATAREIIDGLYDTNSGLGQPSLIVDGQAAWDSYHFIASDANDIRVSYEAADAGLPSPFDINSFQHASDNVRLQFLGGAIWAGMWFIPGVSPGKEWTPDYSTFDKLLIEAKGDMGGETININIEDRDDPHDGSSTKVRLQLTDQWQTYEIDLSEFETADMTMLDAIGFTFYEEPQAFSIRTIKFVKADQKRD
jgi:hypothetical protein